MRPFISAEAFKQIFKPIGAKFATIQEPTKDPKSIVVAINGIRGALEQITRQRGLAYSAVTVSELTNVVIKLGTQLQDYVDNSISNIPGRVRSVVTFTAPSILPAKRGTDYVCFVDSVNVTLPSAVNNNSLYIIKSIAGVCVINTTLSQTIDGAATINLTGVNTSVTVISDGNNWRIV